MAANPGFKSPAFSPSRTSRDKKTLIFYHKGSKSEKLKEREREKRVRVVVEKNKEEEEEEEERQGNVHVTQHVSYLKEVVDGTPYIRGGVVVVELAHRYSRWPIYLFQRHLVRTRVANPLDLRVPGSGSSLFHPSCGWRGPSHIQFLN